VRQRSDSEIDIATRRRQRRAQFVRDDDQNLVLFTADPLGFPNAAPLPVRRVSA